jgi:magnesium-transporting ATPase (P-type)
MKKFKQVMMDWGAPMLALIVPAFAFAQISQPPVTAPSNYTNINQVTGAAGIICVIINWIFWLLIVLTIIFVLIAAFRYLTAAGDPEKVKKAGQTLLYAAIAIIVALIAKGLPLLVSSFIGGGLSGVGC